MRKQSFKRMYISKWLHLPKFPINVFKIRLHLQLQPSSSGNVGSIVSITKLPKLWFVFLSCAFFISFATHLPPFPAHFGQTSILVLRLILFGTWISHKTEIKCKNLHFVTKLSSTTRSSVSLKMSQDFKIHFRKYCQSLSNRILIRPLLVSLSSLFSSPLTGTQLI